MSWAIGFDPEWQRDIGYGVPAYCDRPGCDVQIDRGLGYQCESRSCGCRKFYCEQHRYDTKAHTREAPPAREHPTWVRHVLTHDSWQAWRDENPERVAQLRAMQEGACNA